MSKIKIIFIFLTCTSYAQLQSNIRSYYEHVNNAENLVIKNDLKKAVLCYNEAFKYKKDAFDCLFLHRLEVMFANKISDSMRTFDTIRKRCN